MTRKRITIVFIAFCALMAAAVGGVASMPVAAPSGPAGTAGGSAATSAPPAATGDPVAAINGSQVTNDSTGGVNDCDLIDIDGNDNTVSANLTSNATTGENSNVSVRIHCGAGNAATIDNDFVDIDGDNNRVTLAVRAANGKLLLGGSGAGNTSGLDIATQCEGGTLTDCDVVDIDGDNNSVVLVVTSDDGRTIYEFGSGSVHSTAQSGEQHSTENVSYYQVDFVRGEPIENLRGPNGTYSNGQLIRFAHGSTDTPVAWGSDGEFTTNPSLADRIESRNITVANGTAMTAFTVANDSEPIRLTLASYQKVGPGWSPQTEAKQEFVDSETHTFGPGTHTLRVDLPSANATIANTTDESQPDERR